MAVSANLAKMLDKEYEDKSLQEILDAPVDALAGLTPRHTEGLKELLNIKTVRDLGTNKYITWAAALAELGAHEG